MAVITSQASPTEPLPRDMLHPKSMNVTEAYGAAKLPGPARYAFDYQPQLTVTPRGTWLCAWTQRTTEAERD